MWSSADKRVLLQTSDTLWRDAVAKNYSENDLKKTKQNNQPML